MQLDALFTTTFVKKLLSMPKYSLKAATTMLITTSSMLKMCLQLLQTKQFTHPAALEKQATTKTAVHQQQQSPSCQDQDLLGRD